jgi:hypothetical protein
MRGVVPLVGAVAAATSALATVTLAPSPSRADASIGARAPSSRAARAGGFLRWELIDGPPPESLDLANVGARAVSWVDAAGRERWRREGPARLRELFRIARKLSRRYVAEPRDHGRGL